MRCPDGEPADIGFLNILTELDQINPLRVINKIYKINSLFYHHAEFGFKSRLWQFGGLSVFIAKLFA
jgi:hypothetical protein